MLIESSALFAVSSLLVIGPMVAKSPLMDLFLPILAETQVRAFPDPDLRIGCLTRRQRIVQVIAPLLIIQRVADQSALTSNTTLRGSIGSSKARSRGESTNGSSTLPGGYSLKSLGEHGVGVETVIDIHRDKV